ncbi:MAG: chorismate synthase [Bacteroidales bacterium]|nr:chorismate synthase [Bacteroidales bacterium]
MRNSIGTSVILTLFGESHGEAVGAVLDGLAPGMPVDEGYIALLLSKRRPAGAADTARREPDAFRIVSGVFNGMTTGAPLCILIPNTDVRSEDYAANAGLPRPSHADFTAHVKYDGFEDWRGGGHFSGRLTAAITAAGAILLNALERKGIDICSKVVECAGLKDESSFEEAVLKAKADGDSVGGIVRTEITGLEAGLGEPWFDSLEGALARAVFALGGVKGIEFGGGFALARMRGSQANDQFCVADGRIGTETNYSGGINGGISNGMPVVFNTAVKPTPSISLPQKSVNLETGAEATLEITGRHDPAIVRRISPVITAVTALVISDMLALRHGTDYLSE